MTRKGTARYERLTLRRWVGESGAEPTEASEALRSASCLGPSGMMGVALSPKTLWLWLEYFWWNGDGILNVIIVNLIKLIVGEMKVEDR